MDPTLASGPLEDRLDRLEQRLAGIEARLDRLVAAVDRAPALEPTLVHRLQDTLAMAADTVDELAADAIVRGVDLDASGHAMLALAGQLARPEVNRALLELVEALPALVPAVQLAAQLEPTVAMMFDMVDEHVAGWAARGIDAESRVQAVARIVQRVTDPEFQRHLEVLIDAAPGLMAATRTGELFGHAVDAIQAHPPASVGPVGLLGALRDPDVQRAVGFAVAVARRVGADLPNR